MKKRKPIWFVTWTRRRLLWGATALCLLGLGLMLPSGGPEAVSVSVTNIWSGQGDEMLRKRVEALAKQYDAEPIDAKNDPVWKGIPGLNGVKVDVEATLQQAKSPVRTGRIPLVAKQIPPQVSLDDLGPLPIYRGNPKKKQMALMINVAWGTEYIEEMLETLDKHQAKATFFLDGSWTRQNPSVAKRIAERGHEIGNHAYSHPDMGGMSQDQAVSEIVRTNQVIRKSTGVVPKVFAPPGGAYNEGTVKAAHGQKMRTILWTLDTVDWKKPPAAAIQDKVLSRSENGALVLMHPTEPTRDALRTIVPGLQKQGYGLVTVSELLDPTRPLPSP